MAGDSVEPPLPTVETKLEPKPIVQVVALNPDVRLPEESDQPASKGYIMYANLPTNWTPLPLPDGISSASTPHTDNIRAEIEQAAKLFDVDIQMMKTFAKIESGYNPKAKTGSYKCLFQLSNSEFTKYWQGNIYDIRDCSVAAARKFATEAAQFEKDVGRRATAAELYCIHQQGYEGCSFHYDAPQQLAWKNMYLTTEGQEKGAKWARKAIWGNVPWDLKKTIKGGVEALTSGQFIALWTERVNRFIARKVEPPTSYVQHASKAKRPTRSATTDKKKAKVAASAKKMTKLEAR
ncbi:MAG: transglycosylase [Pseudolabrys sp.]